MRSETMPHTLCIWTRVQIMALFASVQQQQQTLGKRFSISPTCYCQKIPIEEVLHNTYCRCLTVYLAHSSENSSIVLNNNCKITPAIGAAVPFFLDLDFFLCCFFALCRRFMESIDTKTNRYSFIDKEKYEQVKPINVLPICTKLARLFAVIGVSLHCEPSEIL